MADLFQSHAQEWDTRPIPAQISEGVSRALLSAMSLTDDLEVMDFGAGTGLICERVAPLVRSVVAVDISEAMLARLSEKEALKGRVEARCQDILTHPLESQVDLTVSAMAMHHVEDTAALWRTFLAHTRPGGRVALADLDAEDGSFHPPEAEGVFHAGFDRDALRAHIEGAGFVEVEFMTACEVSKEGRSYPIFLVTARRP
jgi:putative AdoMet-dependent methyltransferase